MYAYDVLDVLLLWYYNSNMRQRKDRKVISTNTRYPVDLHRALVRLAVQHKRSFNAEVMWALQWYVEQQEKGEDARDRPGTGNTTSQV